MHEKLVFCTKISKRSLPWEGDAHTLPVMSNTLLNNIKQFFATPCIYYNYYTFSSAIIDVNLKCIMYKNMNLAPRFPKKVPHTLPLGVQYVT